jgi:hypothetical protein
MERKEQNILAFFGYKENINAIFPFFMFFVQCQYHCCLEGEDDNIGNSMQLQALFAATLFNTLKKSVV